MGKILFLVIIIMVVHVARADDVCTPHGFITSNINAPSIFATQAGDCGTSLLVSTPFAFIQTTTHCDTDEYYGPSGCTAYETGDCASAYLSHNGIAPSISDTLGGQCHGSNLVSAPNFYIVDHIKCSAGYYSTADGCTAYETGDGCPSNYYTPNDRFTRPNTTCASGYNTTDYDYCGNTIGADSNYICTPQRKCTTFGTSMLTSETGANWQLYMDMITTPSLVFESDTGNKCYMNTLPGSETDNLIIEYDNTKYHGVKE